MKKRGFYLGSVLLAIVALGFEVVARSQMESAMHIRVQQVKNNYEQHIIKYPPDPEAVRLQKNSGRLNFIGCVFIALAFVLIVIASVRREPGLYSIPILLLFFDFMTLLLL